MDEGCGERDMDGGEMTECSELAIKGMERVPSQGGG